jgi:hypothetical protein
MAAFIMAAVAVVILAPSGAMRALRQPSPITIAVVDNLTRRPLANADVIDIETGRHRLTNEDGKVTLSWPANGVLALRIREVGYKPIERTLRAGKDATDGTATFEMSRTAYVIAPVRSTSRCATDADSASRLLSVTVLEQLRQGAGKYEHFQRQYPFNVVVERRTTAERDSATTKVRRTREHFSSGSWELDYRPGNIVRGADSRNFRVPVLFLSTLADPVFWENHCFVARGVETLNETRVVRLEFSPSQNIRGPDWEGAALLDSATSLLKRVEFRVANLGRNRGPKRFEGYSTFRSPSPFVVMPDTTVAIWWLRRPEGGADWGDPDVGQMLHILELKFRKEPPRN